MATAPNDLSVLARGASTLSPSVPAPPSRWKTRVLVPWAVIGSAAALLAYAGRDAWLPATPVHVVPVVVRTAPESPGGGSAATASTTGAGATIQAPGWVEPDPYPIAVTALTDGVIDEVLVLEGQTVRRGDVIARMVGDDARLALARAEAAVLERDGEVRQAAAARDAAQRDWDNPVERTRAVAFGEAMLAECCAMLDQQKSKIAAEAARVAELEDAVRRKEKSAATNAASESELVQAKLKLDAQRAELETAKAEQPVLAAKVRQQEAELAAARANAELRIAERRTLDDADAALSKARAALNQAKAARDESKLRLARMEIRSPADGVVMSRHVEPGSTMMLSTDRATSAHAVRLYDPKRLQVRVDVPIADAGRISVGQRAKVVVAVAPDVTFNGEVTRIVPEADIQRNTLQAKVRMTDPSALLRPEMLARVRFEAANGPSTGPSASSAQQVFAPETLVRKRPDGQAYVWVVDRGRGVAEVRDVTLGDGRADGWVAVRDGLRPGDQLVGDDASGLHDGQRVTVSGESENGGAHGTH